MTSLVADPCESRLCTMPTETVSEGSSPLSSPDKLPMIPLFDDSMPMSCFRTCCRVNLISCFQSFLSTGQPPFDNWMSCTSTTNTYSAPPTPNYSPPWLIDFFQQRLAELGRAFAMPLPRSSNIREPYLSAIQAHITS